MPDSLIKTSNGFEYVDEDDDRTLDRAIEAFKEDASEPDPDEEEITAEWLPKAFPNDPERQMIGRPISVPEMEGQMENSQFLKSDEVRGLKK